MEQARGVGSRRPWPCALAIVAACGAPPPREAPRPPQAATVVEAAATPPKLGLVGEERVLERPAVGEAPAATPLGRAFERVPLPTGAPPIVAIDGRHERDVWMLGSEGKKRFTLFHWDGARVTKHKGPRCRLEPDFQGLVVTGDAEILVGTYPDGESAGVLESRRRAGDKWSCDKADAASLSVIGGELLRLTRYRELTLGGLRLPLFGGAGFPEGEIAARAADDVWMYRPRHADVAHGNGVAWELRPPGVDEVWSVRVDEAGAAWLLGGEARAGAGTALLRWDAEARAWARLAAPRDLRGQRLLVASARDAWVIGEEHVFHWDGATFQRAATPIEVRGAWLGREGELWLAGVDGRGKGVALRVRGGKP